MAEHSQKAKAFEGFWKLFLEDFAKKVYEDYRVRAKESPSTDAKAKACSAAEAYGRFEELTSS